MEYWFLAKNLSNFVSLPWKRDNPWFLCLYTFICHEVNFKMDTGRHLNYSTAALKPVHILFIQILSNFYPDFSQILSKDRRVHWWRQQPKLMHKNCKQGQLMEKRWKTQCRWWLITMIIDNYENWLRLAHSQIKSSLAFFFILFKKTGGFIECLDKSSR